MTDDLIAVAALVTNLALLLVILRGRMRGRRWFLLIGQAMMLVETPVLAFVLNYYGWTSPEYRWSYTAAFHFETACFMLILLGLNVDRYWQKTCWMLLLLECLARLDCIQAGYFLDVYDPPIWEHYLWEAIDFAWTLILTFDLYSVGRDSSLGESQWQLQASPTTAPQPKLRSTMATCTPSAWMRMATWIPRTTRGMSAVWTAAYPLMPR